MALTEIEKSALLTGKHSGTKRVAVYLDYHD